MYLANKMAMTARHELYFYLRQYSQDKVTRRALRYGTKVIDEIPIYPQGPASWRLSITRLFIFCTIDSEESNPNRGFAAAYINIDC